MEQSTNPPAVDHPPQKPIRHLDGEGSGAVYRVTSARLDWPETSSSEAMARPPCSPKIGVTIPVAGATMTAGRDGSSGPVVRRVVPDMLTPSEIERLRQKQSAQLDLAMKAFCKPAPGRP